MSWKIDVCCVCIPLRLGLFIWGYFALILNYITVLNALFTIQDVLEDTKHFDPLSYTQLSLGLGMGFIHFIFGIVLIAGLHKKSRGLLEIYNGYNIITAIGLIIVMAFYMPMHTYKIRVLLGEDKWIFMLIYLCIAIITLLLQLYLIIAVRSLVSKLEDEKDCTPLEDLSEDPGCILHVYKGKRYSVC